MGLVQEILAKALKELADLADGPKPQDLALLEAKVASARAGQDEAWEDFQEATIRAPFAGIVSLVNVDVDDLVTNESRVVVIIDQTEIDVVGYVNAVDIQFVREGSMTKVTIDSLPEQVFDSVVSTVATEPRTERGTVSYPVTIDVDVPDGVSVPVGLTAVSALAIP